MTFNDQKVTSSSSSTKANENPTNSARVANGTTSTNDEAAYNNIWSQILKEVKHSTKNSPPPKSLILMGDNESGRSTLVSRLKGVDTVSKGIGLEYNYIDVKDEDRDEILKLNVWIPDGDGACTNLLKFALNESNFENTLVCFVVSMSTPWTIMESLAKWSNILREHVTRKLTNLPESKRDEYAKRIYRAFQTYQDPDETTPPIAAAAKGAASTKQAATTPVAAPAATDAALDDDSLLPLDPFILSKNIGLPIAVIVTKSDYISILDKELDYRIEHFDFIQFHIRRFCLEYGASLFYTTVKDKRTYDNLYRYLTHKLYNFSFNTPASVVDREAIFIPSGWDNESKINILMENSATLKSDSDYSEIIPRPSIRKPLTRDSVETILAHDDQEFLAKLQIILNKSSTPPTKSEEMSTAAPMNASATTPTVLKTPHKPPVHKASNPNGTDSTNLKNFFQNLLNKNAPTTSATSAAAAASAAMSSTTPTASPEVPSKLEKSPSANMNSPPQNNPSTPE